MSRACSQGHDITVAGSFDGLASDLRRQWGMQGTVAPPRAAAAGFTRVEQSLDQAASGHGTHDNPSHCGKGGVSGKAAGIDQDQVTVMDRCQCIYPVPNNFQGMPNANVLAQTCPPMGIQHRVVIGIEADDTLRTGQILAGRTLVRLESISSTTGQQASPGRGHVSEAE